MNSNLHNVAAKAGRHSECVCQVYGAAKVVVHWQHAAMTAVLLVAAAILAVFAFYYRNWRRGWLSYRIEQSMREMRKDKAKAKAKSKVDARLVISRIRRAYPWVPYHAFLATKRGLEYAAEDWRRTRLHQPAFISFLFMIAVLLAVLFIPHWPSRLYVFWHPLRWLAELNKDLSEKQPENVSHLFEGLIVVVIALIVFVAESIRSSGSADEKRVLVKISKLWMLATLITLVPIAFIYPPMTRMFVALTLAMILLHQAKSNIYYSRSPGASHSRGTYGSAANW